MKKIVLFMVMTASCYSQAGILGNIIGNVKGHVDCTAVFTVVDSGVFGAKTSQVSEIYSSEEGLTTPCVTARAENYTYDGIFGADSKTLVSMSCAFKKLTVQVDTETCEAKF